MIVATSRNACTVIREPGDKRMPSESAFWVALKRHLNAAGDDLVKRNMEQDGHLMGDKHTFYLRDRKWRYCIFDSHYALRMLHLEYNKEGRVTLARTVWNKDN